MSVFDWTTNTAHYIHGFESCVDTMQLPNVVCALCMTRRFHTLCTCRSQNWRNSALFGRRPVGQLGLCMFALLLMHLFSYLSMWTIMPGKQLQLFEYNNSMSSVTVSCLIPGSYHTLSFDTQILCKTDLVRTIDEWFCFGFWNTQLWKKIYSLVQISSTVYCN